MGIGTFPAATSGGIKSVQRGSAIGSGNVTITAVDITKSFVNVFGTSSSGTVAASGSVGSASGNTGGGTVNSNAKAVGTFTGGPGGNFVSFSFPSTNINYNSRSLSGGSNNLVAAVVQGYLSNSTTLVVSGACRWEVVEFN